jgi:hypothetical protein
MWVARVNTTEMKQETAFATLLTAVRDPLLI